MSNITGREPFSPANDNRVVDYDNVNAYIPNTSAVV